MSINIWGCLSLFCCAILCHLITYIHNKGRRNPYHYHQKQGYDTEGVSSPTTCCRNRLTAVCHSLFIGGMEVL
ncbi:hypothetical protein BGW37DRAFT_218045 [Umbelopsis sp. PMI_123]|nr:hypothetical protein BGW37DRAFT_218045 [Umbelopsis sp. PMI_123]